MKWPGSRSEGKEEREEGTKTFYGGRKKIFVGNDRGRGVKEKELKEPYFPSPPLRPPTLIPSVLSLPLSFPSGYFLPHFYVGSWRNFSSSLFCAATINRYS